MTIEGGIMQRIIVFANQKGGVAKTTTVANLGSALASMGRVVLMGDLDPQANLTSNFAATPTADQPAMDMVLEGEATLEETVVQIKNNLYLIPSRKDLVDTKVKLIAMQGRETRLKRALASATGFDYILLDCSPDVDILTVNALTAAKELMIPLQAEAFSGEGLGGLMETMELTQEYSNPDLKITGVLLTMFNDRINLYKEIRDQAKKAFGGLVFNTVIPRTVRLAEAQYERKDIFAFDPKCRGAEAYLDLCNEILAQEV
jgi:chromosome partitioning protein